MLKSLLQELREFLATSAIMIVTAILVVIFLYDQVLEAYPVPTRSMEPTIEGDSDHGDRVLVDKTWDNFSKPRRFDQVVFWRPDEDKTLVKRIVGLPGEWFRIISSDLFVGTGEDTMARVIKAPHADRDLLARLWDSGLQADWGDWQRRRGCSQLLGEGRVELIPHNLRESELFEVPERPRVTGSAYWSLSFLQAITCSYLDGFDKLQTTGKRARDFGIVTRLRAGTDAIFWCQLRYERLSLILGYQGDGKTRFWACDSDGTVPLGNKQGYDLPPLSRNEDREVRFFHLDGGLCLSVSGKDLVRIELDADQIPFSLTTGISIAATSGSVQVESLSIQHDFHYTTSDQNHSALGVHEPYFIAEDHYFVLGDNSEDSADSRSFGAIPKKHIRGRPWIVVSPLSRFRIFPR